MRAEHISRICEDVISPIDTPILTDLPREANG